MGKGIVRITGDSIAQALGFPDDWKIEDVFVFKKLAFVECEMLISGDDFPETNNRGDAEDCELIIHQQAKIFEVKRSIRKEKG